jgi:2-keto-3-deoxy-galactonokinase
VLSRRHDCQRSSGRGHGGSRRPKANYGIEIVSGKDLNAVLKQATTLVGLQKKQCDSDDLVRKTYNALRVTT